MDFKRARDVLIVVFLIINIFLAGSLYFSANEAAAISESEMENAIYLLSLSDISFDRATVSKKKSDVCSYIAQDRYEDAEKIAKRFFANNFSSDESGQIFYNNNLTITFQRDFYINIRGYLSGERKGGISEKDALKTAKSVIKKMSGGNNIKISVIPDGAFDGYFFKTVSKISGTLLRGMDVNIWVRDDGYFEAGGVFLYGELKIYDDHAYSSPVNAVLAYKNYVSGSDRIEKMELIYRVTQSADGVFVVPVWEITGQETSVFLDALTYKQQ